MPFHLNRRIRIAPGVHLNISKSGISASLGPRGAHVTIGRKGVRETVGLPGSGISYTETQPWPAPAPGAARRPLSAGAWVLLLVLAGLFLAWAFS